VKAETPVRPRRTVIEDERGTEEARGEEGRVTRELLLAVD